MLGETRDDGGASGRTVPVYPDGELFGAVAVGEGLRITGTVRRDRRDDGSRFYLDGVAVDGKRSGRSTAGGAVPEQLGRSIPGPWESVVDRWGQPGVRRARDVPTPARRADAGRDRRRRQV